MDVNNQVHSKILLLASIASIIVALTLIILKTWAGLKTGSVSVLASLMDSLTDLLASIINLIGISIGLKPADENHNFGHAKAEGISSLIQATFILGSAVFLIFSAADRLAHPQPIEQTQIAIFVMIITILMTGALSLFQHCVMKKTNSLSLEADALHYASDFLLNGSVILALILIQFGYTSVDSIFAMIIGLWMIYLASKIMRDSFAVLMDETLPGKEVMKIQEIILATPGVKGFHNLMTRSDGKTHYVNVHIEIDEHQTFKASHDIATNVVDNLKELSNNTIEVFIHTDPCQSNYFNGIKNNQTQPNISSIK